MYEQTVVCQYGQTVVYQYEQTVVYQYEQTVVYQYEQTVVYQYEQTVVYQYSLLARLSTWSRASAEDTVSTTKSYLPLRAASSAM